MINILICDPNYAPSVNRDSTIIKIQKWQRKKAKISILCSSEAKNFYQKKLKNVDFLTFPFQWKSKSFWTVSIEYIRANTLMLPMIFRIKEKFDVVYSLSSTLDFLFFPWILTFFDKKIGWFVVVDNIVPKPSERPGNFLLKAIPYIAFLIGNQLLKRADAIFVVTNFLRRYYESKEIRVIKTGNGYGIDTEIFKGKISADSPRFNSLYCGRLHIAKGVFDIVEVAKRVVNRNKNFVLGIMGDGDDSTKKALYDKITEYNLNRSIIFTGYKSGKEKGDIFRACGLFLFLSYDEGCPQVVIEAFAAKKLVVAYDLSVYYDVFAKYIKNGELVLFKKGSIEEIADYISNYNAKSHIFKNRLDDYTWEIISSRELESFYEVINKNVS